FASFDADEKAIILPLETCDIFVINNLVLDENESVQTIKPLLSDEKSKNAHIQLIKNAIEATTSDEFQKIVLSRNERVSLTNSQPISIFKKLLATYETAFVYCWFHPKIGLWL